MRYVQVDRFNPILVTESVVLNLIIIGVVIWDIIFYGLDNSFIFFALSDILLFCDSFTGLFCLNWLYIVTKLFPLSRFFQL